MARSTPGTGDQPYEPEWSSFIKSLTTCLPQLRAKQYLVLQLQSRPARYVQFAQDGPVGFRAESVSNYYLRDADLLTPEDETRLRTLGWHTPVAPDDMTTERPPNWHMMWTEPVPFSAVAELAVDTLTDVHQAHLPTDLSYRAFDQDGTEASFPILGIPQYVAVQQPANTQPPESPSNYYVQTRRPLVGPVGEALASSNGQRERLVQNILNHLDQGEGWTLQRDAGATWYPGRLAVEFQCPPDDRVLRLDTRVADIQEESPTLQSLLNELNVNAAGWWWWIDHMNSSVHCSINCAVDTATWWWPNILMGVLPNYAATTEALANRLAMVGRGSVVQASHPEKGPRPELDGWILGTRLGERQPVASLDLWLSTLELARFQAALGVLWPDYEHRVSWPLCASIVDNSGRVRVMLRRHWHPEFGWGWQIAAVSGIANPGESVEAEGLRLTTMLNERQARSSSALNRFGGWSYVPKLGLVHLTFVPALEIELLLATAGSTIGNIAALVMDVGIHLSDLQDAVSVTQASGSTLQIDTTRADELDESAIQVKLSTVHIDVGPHGWPYRDQDLQVATLAGQEPDDAWLIPRHAIICSFGIFNPMGPTVSSLEAAYLCSDGGSGRWVLYFAMRHPLSPKLVRLGHSDTWEGLGEVISASLEDAERAFGTGPQWLDIQAHQAAVLAGTRKFAEAHPDSDWRREADSLLTASSYPWKRVSPGFSPGPVDWPAEADPIDCWIEAVTNLDVIAGHQLFMRSAWDGAQQLAANNWSFEAAQAAATRDQAVELPRAQDDFEFRGQTEPFVKHATVVGPSELARLDGVPRQRIESAAQQADVEWSNFSHALAICLGQLKVDQFLILNSHGYYVQFAQHGPRGLLAESVSNQFLEDFELLSSDGEKRLQELGWVEPERGAGDRQGPSNWSKEWLQPVPYLAVADLATQTLRSVYGVSAPIELVYKAFDRSDAAVFLPNLGVPRSELAKPVTPDTSKKQATSDLIGPTDVAWNLWKNSTEPIGQDNVGWNLWNMSNRISFVRNLAVRARERLVEAYSMEQWPAEDIAEFTRLTEAAEEAAQRATNLWEQLCAMVASTDPTLIEPLEQGVSVIHNHGGNPELMARVWAAWKADTSRDDAQVISDKLEALLAQHGLPAIKAFGRLKQPVANDEPSPSGTQTNQTGSTGRAMEARPTSTNSTNLPPCPSCRAHEVVPVIYGVPDSVLLPIFRSGGIRPGGAFGRLADHTGPHWYCRSCGGAWRGGLFQGSGDSPDDPVVISGVTDDAVFIRAEKMFLVERFGLSADEVKEGSGWRLSQQALVRCKTGALDLMTVVLASGEQREILFQLPK